MLATIAKSSLLELIEALNWIYSKSKSDQLLLNPTKALILHELHHRKLRADSLAYNTPTTLQ